MIFFHRKRKNSTFKDIAPDEIFLDSRNSPSFNTYQLEGKIERPITKKVTLVVGLAFIAIGAVFMTRLWFLQIERGVAYAEQSENNSLEHQVFFARRGVILDRNGEELAWNEPSDEFDFSLRRYVDDGGFFHVLGSIEYPQKDDKGIYYRFEYEGIGGVEEGYGEVLTGTNGLKITEIDVHNSPVSESTIVEPVHGENLMLSIDKYIQAKLYSEISSLVDRASFRGGAGAIMDLKTGELLALASYPEIHPQVFTDRKPRETIESALNDPSSPFLNRATAGRYTPGSIMKLFVALAALGEGTISPEKKILSTGSITVKNPYNPDEVSVFNDWKAHGWVDMRDALAYSSNVYFYTVGGGFGDQRGVGIDAIEKYVKAFGIGEKTGISAFSEKTGIIPSPEWKKENFEDETWRLGDTYNSSIGQYGFLVTPLAMLKAVGAIATEGMLIQPTIRKGEASTRRGISIDIPASHYDIVQEGMRAGVQYGTATALNVPYVLVAAKTGTAELDAAKNKVNSWVIGYYPYEEPRYAFVVMMEGGPYKNLFGAPLIMRSVLDWIAVYAPHYLE